MAIKPHPNFDEIKQTIQKLSKKGREFSAVCYRFIFTKKLKAPEMLSVLSLNRWIEIILEILQVMADT